MPRIPPIDVNKTVSRKLNLYLYKHRGIERANLKLANTIIKKASNMEIPKNKFNFFNVYSFSP